MSQSHIGEQKKKCGGRHHYCDVTWSDWSHYGQCSKSCGNGIKSRERECLHGEIGSPNCMEIDSRESVLCNTHNCYGLLVFGGDSYRNSSSLIDPVAMTRFNRHVALPRSYRNTDFHGSCAAVFQGKVVVVGHINTARRNKAFWLNGTQWNSLPDTRDYRNGAACAVYQERLVLCAGGNANGGQTCEMLPPHMQFWDRFPSILTYRSWGPGMAAASWGLVIAGSYYSNSNSEILIDRRTGWKYGPNFEIGIGSTIAVTANDKVYVVGGYQAGNKIKLDNQTLLYVCAIKVSRREGNHRKTIINNNHLYRYDHFIPNQNYDFKNVFELASPDAEWRSIGALNRVRYYHAACTVYGKIWLFGGHSNETDVVEVFTISSGKSIDTEIRFNSTQGMRYPSVVVLGIG